MNTVLMPYVVYFVTRLELIALHWTSKLFSWFLGSVSQSKVLSELFEHDGAGPAASVADGGDSPLPGLEGAGQVGGDAGAGGAQRVTQADRAAVDVHLERNKGCCIDLYKATIMVSDMVFCQDFQQHKVILDQI